MHNNNLYIAEEFKTTYDFDGSVLSYQGPTIHVGETDATICLDLDREDQPRVSIDKRDGDFTSDELRALIPVLQRVLYDMEQYEGGQHDNAF